MTDIINDFDELQITTMCPIYSLNAEIDIRLLFLLLEITACDLDKKSKTKVRCKLTNVTGLPIGTVISANHAKEKRGIIRNIKKDLKNSIQAYISIGEKTIYCSIYKKTINLYGIKSFEQGEKSIQIIFDNIDYIKDMMFIFNNNKNIFNIVEQVTKSPRKYLIKSDNGKFVSTIINKLNSIEKSLFLFQSMKDEPSEDESSGSGIKLTEDEKRCVIYLIKLSIDFDNYDEYMKKINWIRDNITNEISLYDGELSINSFYTSMMNFNYNLGFRIDLSVIAEIINTYENYFCNYDNNASNKGLQIYKTYDPIPGRPISKTKVQHISILIYSTGQITQSGPDRNTNKDIYYEFLTIMYEHMNSIREK